MNAKWFVPAIVFLAAVGIAAAEESPRIDQIVASDPYEDEAAEDPWSLTLEELERAYPAVARAVRAPNRLVDVADGEQESTSAFFARMHDGGHEAVSVDGVLHEVSIAIAGGGMTPPEATSPRPESGAETQTVPAFGAVAVAAVAGAGAVLARRR